MHHDTRSIHHRSRYLTTVCDEFGIKVVPSSFFCSFVSIPLLQGLAIFIVFLGIIKLVYAWKVNHLVRALFVMIEAVHAIKGSVAVRAENFAICISRTILAQGSAACVLASMVLSVIISNVAHVAKVRAVKQPRHGRELCKMTIVEQQVQFLRCGKQSVVINNVECSEKANYAESTIG